MTAPDTKTSTTRQKGASLPIRLFSALIALVGLFALLHFVGAAGMKGLCLAASLFGTRELMRMLFNPDDSKSIRALFFVLMMLLFYLTTVSIETSGLAFTTISIIFFSASIWMRHRFHDLRSLTNFQAKSIMGFLYMGLLPGFGSKILDVKHGEMWFMALLAFVLTGDSLAYFVGVYLGRNPLLPEISPKKTVEGALGGIAGSAIAGLALVALFPRLPWGPVLTLATLAGLTGQMGDLFESLLKRVANQKDSGSLMPGHGGVLDRLDGVLFAAPIVLIGATIIERGLASP